MSAKRLSLKSPPVIAAVLVMLVVVTVANIRTFGPRKKGQHAAAVRVQEYPSLPPDLSEMVKNVGEAMRSPESRDPRRWLSPPRLGRDPFAAGQPEVEDSGGGEIAGDVEETSDLVGHQGTDSIGGLRCTAVMIMDGQTVALVGGQLLGPGDFLGRYLVISVDLEGALLRDEAGGTLHLNIWSRDEGDGTFEVGAEDRTQESGVRMTLVDDVYMERIQP